MGAGYPVPRNLNYFWNFGVLAGFCLVLQIVPGVILAMPPVDYLMHNTTFLVAHFHNMLIPGALFGYFAALNLWFPKAMGFKLEEMWGKRSFWCWVIGLPPCTRSAA